MCLDLGSWGDKAANGIKRMWTLHHLMGAACTLENIPHSLV